MDTVIEREITFMCTECGNLSKGKVNVVISSELDISSIDMQLELECEKCHSVSVEVQEEISEALSVLQSKRYKVIKSDQCEYNSDLYAPYVIINTEGISLPSLPEGWVYAYGYNSISKQKMIVPEGSFGVLDKEDSIRFVESYKTDDKFTANQFYKTRKKYIAQLKAWAESLPYNSTIAVPRKAADIIEKDIIDVE